MAVDTLNPLFYPGHYITHQIQITLRHVNYLYIIMIVVQQRFPHHIKKYPEKYTAFSTSHYATPTPDGLQNLNGPSGGNRVFISCKDYRGLMAGKVLLTDLVARHPHQNNQMIKTYPQTKLDRINNNELRHSDQPWMSQGMDGVTLQRGDVVCAFSDGVGDNLSRDVLDDIYNLWSNTVGYMHPAIRVQHPATRNVKPITPNMMKPGGFRSIS
eukprot:UN00962